MYRSIEFHLPRYQIPQLPSQKTLGQKDKKNLEHLFLEQAWKYKKFLAYQEIRSLYQINCNRVHLECICKNKVNVIKGQKIVLKNSTYHRETPINALLLGSNNNISSRTKGFFIYPTIYDYFSYLSKGTHQKFPIKLKLSAKRPTFFT